MNAERLPLVAATVVLALTTSLTPIASAGSQPSGTDRRPGGAHRTPSSLTLALSPVYGPSAPQGMPFALRVHADNPDPDPVDLNVTLRVVSHRAGPSVSFARWTALVPANGSAESRLEVISAQWFSETGEFLVSASDDTTGASDTLPYQVVRSPVPVPRFQDVTAAAGLDTTEPAPACWRFGAGAAWGDVEGDGDPDLYVPVEDGPSQLWINDGAGRFTEQASLRGVDDGGSVGMGATFVDYDNDGDQDLYVVNDDPDRLYRNDGTGMFTDVAPQAGVADPGHGPSASWADYDGDGWLDLYVTNYIGCGPPGSEDGLYHNDGDGTFTNVTDLLGPPGTTGGAGFQAAWFDYDGDGDQDLYLVNDVVNQEYDGNHLWRNEGSGPDGWRFVEVADESGLGFSVNSMGIGLGDIDGDLDLDVAVSNINGNLLAANRDGLFTEVAEQAGVRRALQSLDHPAVTWGLGFFDLNADGFEDLYVAAGDIYGAEPQANELFAGGGVGGRFLDLSAPSGADSTAVTRGVAFADMDRDGRMDLYVVNQLGSPILYRNVTPFGDRHWLELQLTGTVSARDACGARVVLSSGGRKMLREVLCGSISVGSGSDRILHFGLGTGERAERMDVFWPSGRHQVIRHLEADRLISVTEPTT